MPSTTSSAPAEWTSSDRAASSTLNPEANWTWLMATTRVRSSTTSAKESNPSLPPRERATRTSSPQRLAWWYQGMTLAGYS